MDSLTHFHSKNVYFYIHQSYRKVTALSIFQNFWVDTNLFKEPVNQFDDVVHLRIWPLPGEVAHASCYEPLIENEHNTKPMAYHNSEQEYAPKLEPVTSGY